MKFHRFIGLCVTLVAAVGCASQSNAPPAATPASPAMSVAPTPPAEPATAPAQPPATTLSRPIDASEVTMATGVENPESSIDGVKVSVPRKDVDVAVDGWKLAPFMGVTSWAAFSPAKAGVTEAMVMGDLVLFEDEVNPVMSVLFENGIDVTALHNHFFFDAPRVYFMHIGGEGTVAGLGKGVRLAFDKVAEIRKRAPKPAARSGVPALPAKSNIDGAKVEAILGRGVAKDGMYKTTKGRSTNAACGCRIGERMGVNTWSAFAGTDDNAVVDGDFAVSESELVPVLKSLRSGGINIVAIHHHMIGESPKIPFVHYWGRGKVVDLARSVRKALDLTMTDDKLIILDHS